MSKLSRTKVLVPLATLVAAGAIAVGSGATFSSTSSNSVSAVTAGTLTSTNSKANAAVFTVPAMKPGDVVNGSLTLTNTGTLPATYTLQEPTSTNTFGIKTGTTSDLQLTITNTTDSSTVYSGNFGGLATSTLTPLGTFAAGATKTYNFSVALDSSSPNTDQGKTASATFQWVGTQVDAGQTTNQ